MGHLSPASGLPLARRDDVSATLHRWEAAMADESSEAPKPEPRRALGYSSLGARALVIRETDAMRDGIRGLLREVSMARLVVGLPQALPAGEQINLRLRNLVQRFRKEARGIVRLAEPDKERADEYLIEVELFTRLTPLEVSLLRMGIRDNTQREPRWM